MTPRRMERRLEQIRLDAVDRIQREERTRRDLEEHLRKLADELDREIARTQPNPWLKPWDPGYESPTLIALRLAAEAPSSPIDADAVARRMELRLAEIRRRNRSTGVSTRKRARQPAPKRQYRSLVEFATSPAEVAALAPKQREGRRR
jgi:hypothetical protein